MKTVTRIIFDDRFKRKTLWFYDEDGSYVGHIDGECFVSNDFRERLKEIIEYAE